MFQLTVAQQEYRLPFSSFPAWVPSIAEAGHIFDELNERLIQAAAKLDDALPRAESESCRSMTYKARAHCSDGRSHVEDNRGRGYWDFYRFSAHLFMSVTNVCYRENTWFSVPRENVLKIRILLAGELLAEDKTVLARGPAGILCAQTNQTGSAYFVKGGVDTKLVILHCKADLLSHTLGLTQSQMPSPFDSLFRPEHQQVATSRRVRLSPALFRAASEIVNAAENSAGAARNTYLHGKCLEVLGLILQNVSTTEVHAEGGLNDADLKRILSARGFLTEHLAEPPTLRRLSRFAGINQTKLKAGFKSVTGLTISQFVLRSRMERAAELLLTNSRSVGEVSYELGYGYPANFTMAFKKYFGYLPKDLKKSASYG